MYYHASNIGKIAVLEPRISNHQTPLVYFSQKRENVLVYLSNAVEKFCKENGFQYAGIWQKWASYGFDKDGIQHISEYYPDALVDTYKGVSGFIYSVERVDDCGFQTKIPFAAASEKPVKVSACEHVNDAYHEILSAEKRGLIRITRYNQITEKMREWIFRSVREEYKNAVNHPEYRFFLEGKFGRF